MSRSFDEVVHVKVEQGEPEAPTAFVWRGRLFVVREVLATWSSRLPWWQGVEARALRGEAVEVRGSSALVRQPGSRAAGPAADEQVWRVAASAGFGVEPGTFELACAPAESTDTSGSTAEACWRLVRVVD
ncbi:hypothetical protein SAMN06264364_11198 [Quadrisphaera granulorum]|uniref:DUF6504 domain-containing protein n=1 Tax=Quadrisphaera granulorum TaxID=317664 RepID=A0A316A7K0_9ACTN|nr:DUF6504 family protein [Quadrisphaera granulorum]PWJ53695.1 hypothetical protein BXY45_11198 [Quadrisphaera granulorum]SZE96739.1 hypothetical protein SAMN06264364_11198 [Quadrisphaera granulorum]